MKPRFPNNEIPAEVLKDLSELSPKLFTEKYGVSNSCYYHWKKKYGLSASSKFRNKDKKRANNSGRKFSVRIEIGGATINMPIDEEIKIKIGR